MTTLPDTDHIIGVTFAALCTPAAGAEIVSLINFAAEPPPAFSDTRGNYVAGVVGNGSVRIGPPLPPGTATPTPTVTVTPPPTGTGTPTASVTPPPTATPVPGTTADSDNDGVSDQDELRNGTNPLDADSDDDGFNDLVDAFPLDRQESKDNDQDGIGDNADPDDDNDGVADGTDAFPLDANEAVDTDGDGVGNNADADDDGDGVADGNDAFPLNANEAVDTDGDGVGNNADADDDGDGVNDANDACPLVNGGGRDANGNGCTDTINDLTSLIQSFRLQKGTETSLLAKANAALTKLNSGDKAGALDSLQALLNETKAQRGKKIPATQADVLTAFVQNVIAGL